MEGVKNSVKLVGEVELKVFDKNGNLKDRRVYKNVIVNDGKARAAALLNGQSTTYFSYIAIGTGTTAESATDTALESEVDRQAATTSVETTNVTNDTAVWQATFTFTTSYAITESGIFDSASGGTMLARKTFSAINVESGDSLQVTWKVVVQ